MGRYVREVDGDTSVKLIQIIEEPTRDSPGVADFTYKPVFSVFDYGTIVPPTALDNSTVCLMAAFNFELLEEQGIPTHYLGLVTDDGELITAREAIQRSTTGAPVPTTMRLKFVNRVKPTFTPEQGWDYSMFTDPETRAYVHPLEFISRNSLPEASSVWGRIERGEVTLADFGLPSDFKKGDTVPDDLRPLLDYSTKFEPDDRYISRAVAQGLVGVSDARFARINGGTRQASNLMTDYATSVGFTRHDGKVEWITWYDPVAEEGNIHDALGDAVCTWHEDRLVTHGVGISKQRIRNKVASLNPRWYGDIKASKARAKAEGVEDFRTLMDPSITYTSPTPEFFGAVNTLFRAGTNQWVGADVYRLFPGFGNDRMQNLEQAVEEFRKVA